MENIKVMRTYSGKTDKRNMKHAYAECEYEIQALFDADMYTDDNYCYQLGGRFTDDVIEFTYIPESVYDRVLSDVATICNNYAVLWFDGESWH
jgi:hypothetical protein